MSFRTTLDDDGIFRSTFLVKISNTTGPHPDLSGRILKKAEGGRKVGGRWALNGKVSLLKYTDRQI